MARTRRRSVLVGALVAIAVLLVAAVGYMVGSQNVGRQASQIASESRALLGAPDQTDMSYGGAVAPSTEAPAEPMKSTAQGVSAESGSASPNSVDKLIIRNSSMEVRVKSVDSAIDDLRRAAARAGADISDLSVSAGDPGVIPLESGGASPARGPASAYVTMRVAADKLAALEKEVAGLGVVLSQSASAADVTEQAIDLDARLRNLRAEEARLRSFLQRTAKVSELLEVERELARVRGEIESMDAQLTYLERQAARATLSVTLSEPGPVVQPAGPTWGLREAITRGIQATASLVATLITIAIPLAILGGLALLIAWPVRVMLRRRSARRTSSTESEAESLGDEG